MNIVYEKIRIGIDKALLSAGRSINKLSGGKAAKSMFTASLDVKHVGTSVKILSENDDSVTIAKVDKDGNILDEGFRILSTTDLHFGDITERRNKCMGMLMRHIIDTKPDLVVLTGDIILGKYQHIDAIQFAQFMEMMGVYWAFTFGNHEAREEKGRFKELLMKCQTTFPHCLARQGKKELFGLCNYCVTIMKSENEILKTLFMLDSGRDIIKEYCDEHGCPKDYKGYDFIKNNQMNWYENKLKELEEKHGKPVKSFMYMHIPIKEYEYAVAKDENGEFTFTEKCRICYGEVHESVGSSQFNSGLFALAKKLGSTQAFYSGHDHINDFCAIYDDVYLVYNQCGGYENYNIGTNKGWPEEKWPQGVTITDIASDGSFEIYPRYNRDYL